jgi:hypothetical protein
MRLLRGLLGALLWILASVVGLLGIITSLTLILLPVGIPLLRLAGRLFGQSTRLFMPPAVAHPARETKRRSQKTGKAAGKLARKTRRKMVEKAPSMDFDAKGAKKATGKFLARQRGRIG